MTKIAWLALHVAVATVSLANGPCGPRGCLTTPSVAPIARTPDGVRASLAGVVRIVHRDAGGTSLGSGAVVANGSSGCFILTCAHLFDGPGRTEIVIARRSKPASIVAIDQRNDLALLRSESTDVQAVPIAQGAPTGVLTACGFGGSGELRCVTGEIVGRSRAVGADASSLRIRGAVRSGDSGGPVLDAGGRLVAVIWGQRGGETYATTDGLLRRILQRLPSRGEPPARPEVGSSNEYLAWRKRIEQRLDRLIEQPREKLPDDLVRRGDLLSLSQQWDRQFDRLSSQVNIDVAAPSTPAAGHGLQDLLSGVPAMMTTFAVGGPLGVGVWAVSRWLTRRGGIRGRSRERPIAVDTPPPPQQVVPETHYVSYERDEFAKAHQWASEQLARKFPGSVEMLTSLDSLIKQQLNGS